MSSSILNYIFIRHFLRERTLSLLFILLFIALSCKGNSSEEVRKSKSSYVPIRTDTIIVYDKSTTILKCIYKYESDSLLFRLSLPKDYDSSGTFPLLLFFHGAGERGDDNVSQMNLISDFIESDLFQKQSSFVVLPQCPAGEKWVDADWLQLTSTFNYVPERSMSLTIKLLNRILDNYKVDTNKLYVMGLSMGGFGTWDIITRMPDKFAAAVPICGGGDEEQAYKLSNIPIWAFHGSKDKLVNVSRSRNIASRVKSFNGNIIYTEYKNVGHNAWSYAFKDSKLMSWIYSKSKFRK
jgi:predicted peptidase